MIKTIAYYKLRISKSYKHTLSSSFLWISASSFAFSSFIFVSSASVTFGSSLTSLETLGIFSSVGSGFIGDLGTFFTSFSILCWFVAASSVGFSLTIKIKEYRKLI